MTVTVHELVTRHPGWRIHAMTEGWAAVRDSLVPRGSALSNVRCGETLDDLAENLLAEAELEAVKGLCGATRSPRTGPEVRVG